MVGLSRENIYQHHDQHHYFKELTFQKGLFYALAVFYLVAASFVVTLEPFIQLPCTFDPDAEPRFENAAYVDDPCRRTRFWQLLGLTAEECMFGRRLVWSVVLGGIVGWERRQADRPAGIRTMSLVSLGSCLFTVNSAFAFLDGPMTWDASRVSAAIPSGVGFLGAGMIFKEADKDEETGQSTHVVHGLTTAASLWLSAAVGIACGGGLYFAASFCVAIMLVLLRFGPRHFEASEHEGEKEEEEPSSPPRQAYASTASADTPKHQEMQPILGKDSNVSHRASTRAKKAQLASIV